MADANAYMAEFADNLWKNFIKPKMQSEAQDSVTYYRAVVTSNPANGTLNVQKPFDNIVNVRCTQGLASAVAGDKVVVLVFGKGNAANHIAISLDSMEDISTLQLGTANPKMNGTVKVGTSLYASHEDHVHPVDTSRQKKLSASNKLNATFISGLLAQVESEQAAYQFYHTFGMVTTSISGGSWQNVTTDNINVTETALNGGYYLVNYVVSIKNTSDGMATCRFTLGGSEITDTTNRTRQSVPTKSGLVSTFNATFIWKATDAGAFNGYPQVYASSSFTADSAFIGLIRLGDTWTSS